MNRLEARILGVSVWGPGLQGWAASVAALSGAADYAPVPSPAPPPAILSAMERRRTGPVARLALAVASEAAAMSGLPAGSLRGVFASASGDGLIVGSILDDLTRSADAARLVSPTQFHNSVHNAAAGYWSIATASERPITCLACHDATWAAGLTTALAELATQGEPVLLCAYDHPMPPPLDVKRPTIAPFGVALVLSPAGTTDGLAGISVPIRTRTGTAGGRCAQPAGPATLGRRQCRGPLAAIAGIAGAEHGRLACAGLSRRSPGCRGDTVTYPAGLDRAAIAALIPHAHRMMLLDRAESWDASSLRCRTYSHLDPANPLRRCGRLATLCGIEYGLQATALHGALVAGGIAQAYRFLAALRDVTLQADRLDDPERGALEVVVQLQRQEATGSIYAMQLRSGDGRPVLAGRAVIAVPPRS